MSAVDWLDRRLGCRGRGRLAILELLRSQLEREAGTRIALGMSREELADALSGCDLDALAQTIPWRGDSDRLARIVWWGSALGDIAALAMPADRQRILREAGLFNLAVALFDSVVDEAPALIGPLAEALHPRKLKRRIECPMVESSRLRARGVIGPLVEIFDVVTTSVGTRLGGKAENIQRLTRLLEQMFRSELGLTADGSRAKRLPVTFIGALADGASARDLTILFEHLAEFLVRWDDWLDLGDDLLRLRDNYFLGTCRRPLVLAHIRYGFHAIDRIAGGRKNHPTLAGALAETMEAALIVSLVVGEPCHGRLVTLFEELIH